MRTNLKVFLIGYGIVEHLDVDTKRYARYLAYGLKEKAREEGFNCVVWERAKNELVVLAHIAE